MLYRTILTGSLTGAALLICGAAMSVVQAQTQEQAQTQQQIFGSQLMTSQERTEYRAKLRDAKTVEERERIRSEHHKEMLERARERGVTLPEEPPARGGGMGPGGGMGRGMGPSRNP